MKFSITRKRNIATGSTVAIGTALSIWKAKTLTDIVVAGGAVTAEGTKVIAFKTVAASTVSKAVCLSAGLLVTAVVARAVYNSFDVTVDKK